MYIHIMLAQYAHSFRTTSQLTNTCSELDSGLFAPPSGRPQVLQYFPFCKICSMGTLSCSWLVGTFESESTPFCRETLLGLSSIANANITCSLIPHGACFPRLLARSKGGEAMGRRAMFLLASSPGNSWCWVETCTWLWQPSSWHRSFARASSFLTTGVSGS